MDFLQLRKSKIYLTLEVQTSTSGRPFRFSGTRINENKPPIWVNKQLKYHFIHDFRYFDLDGDYVSFEFDYYDVFVGKVSQETNNTDNFKK